MVLILTDSGSIELDDDLANYSTFMRASSSFERSRSGNNEVDMTNMDIYLIKNYINFLKRQDFSMREEDYEFFHFMGHVNNDGYSMKSWAVMLRENLDISIMMKDF